MTISLRSVKMLMHSTSPGRKISADAARLLKVYIERRAKEITIHASRIHDAENSMCDQIGARRKKVLALRHIKMAIDGKYPGLQEEGRDDSEH